MCDYVWNVFLVLSNHKTQKRGTRSGAKEKSLNFRAMFSLSYRQQQLGNAMRPSVREDAWSTGHEKITNVLAAGQKSFSNQAVNFTFSFIVTRDPKNSSRSGIRTLFINKCKNTIGFVFFQLNILFLC